MFQQDRKEIEYYRKKLDNNHPFISENGGGIFIPKGYFPFDLFTSPISKSSRAEINQCHMGGRLGARYEDLRTHWKNLEDVRAIRSVVSGT